MLQVFACLNLKATLDQRLFEPIKLLADKGMQRVSCGLPVDVQLGADFVLLRELSQGGHRDMTQEVAVIEN